MDGCTPISRILLQPETSREERDSSLTPVATANAFADTAHPQASTYEEVAANAYTKPPELAPDPFLPETVPFNGGDHGLTGELRKIREVRVQPLHDSKGRLTGVSFPSKVDTVSGEVVDSHAPAWSRMPNSTVPTQIRGAVFDRWNDWTIKRTVEKAPWEDGVKESDGPDLLIADAHGGERGFAVNANTGETTDTPNWQTVLLPGEAYAKLLIATQLFQKAMTTAGGKTPLLMASCIAGGTEHGAAAAAVLQTNGVGDIYAPKGRFVAVLDESGSASHAAVEVPGRKESAIDHIVKYPAPQPDPSFNG